MNTKLNGKANSSHKHTVSDITDYSSNPPAASNIWPFPISWSKIKTFSKSYPGYSEGITADSGVDVSQYDAIAFALTKLGGTFTNASNYNKTEITLSINVGSTQLIKIVQDLAKSGTDPTGWNMNNAIITPYRGSLIRLNKYMYRYGSLEANYNRHTYLVFSDMIKILPGSTNIDVFEPVVIIDELTNDSKNLSFVLARTKEVNSCNIQNFSFSLDIYGGLYN